MRQSYARTILPLVEHNSLKWSRDKYNATGDNVLGFSIAV